MAESKSHSETLIWMSGTYPAKDILLKRAIVHEKLSTLTETTIEFQSKNKAVKLADILGRTMSVHIKTAKNRERIFSGTVVSVECVGMRDGYGHYVAEVRPWFWLLTRTQDSRVFQEMSAVEIIEQIFSENGFTDFVNRLSETGKKRTYCVQYRESDYDFICRLMEEEGIYYYFDNKMDKNLVEKMTLCDGVSGHSRVPENATIEYHAREKGVRRRVDHIAEWASEEVLARGKITLNDFDFLTPAADFKVSEAIKKGMHNYQELEIYDAPGRYRKDADLGTSRARVRMEAEAVRHRHWRGAGSVRTLGTGYTFTLKDHPDEAANIEYLVTDATHYFKVSTDFTEVDARRDLDVQNMDFPENMETDTYACTFGAIPKLEQFRAPLITPWPEIPGLHTATVVGNEGEEITTDEYGRIKVQFHWDREGKDDQDSSCWIRVVTPWSGKGWGIIALPRMGQEVVIQFEEGDPDRPICTGMLYNKDTMPPYELPANKTQSGVKTNSSKGGSGYNELMFEDKKGSELMRLQAQKDHQMLIKNKSSMAIGVPDFEEEHFASDNSLHQVVKQDVTETILDGDHFFTIEKGSQEIVIETDKTQQVNGKHTQTIKGNYATSVTSGNVSVDVDAGKIEMTAALEILLTVGGSSIKIDNSGVTIKGPIIKIEGDAMVEAKSPMTTVKGSALLTLKGGVTMIN
ncbi:MAG: type VI secretion system tip protein VgrG [Rhodobacteraceae bacterium]|nr:type VI secretion system tip protein VgrG [Paracoccaceae bacterium]